MPSTPAARPSYRVLRHQLLSKILELVLTPVDITVESELQVMSEPPRADLLLLRRHGKVWTAAQRKLQRLYQMEDEAMTQELTVDDVMAIGDKLRKQAIASASVKERLAGLAPEERLAGLAPEELERLQKQIESLLAQQSAEQPRHRKPTSKK
ncbi:MAG: hypothetical protein IPK16_10350 [Anaerolineales bacterium]|nr:hypothetical protein [Anaerolineales bacterium]